MRKFISLKTLTIAHSEVKAGLEAALQNTKGADGADRLRELFSADSELTEAVSAATKEPTPEELAAKKAKNDAKDTAPAKPSKK